MVMGMGLAPPSESLYTSFFGILRYGAIVQHVRSVPLMPVGFAIVVASRVATPGAMQ